MQATCLIFRCSVIGSEHTGQAGTFILGQGLGCFQSLVSTAPRLHCPGSPSARSWISLCKTPVLCCWTFNRQTGRRTNQATQKSPHNTSNCTQHDTPNSEQHQLHEHASTITHSQCRMRSVVAEHVHGEPQPPSSGFQPPNKSPHQSGFAA